MTPCVRLKKLIKGLRVRGVEHILSTEDVLKVL